MLTQIVGYLLFLYFFLQCGFLINRNDTKSDRKAGLVSGIVAFLIGAFWLHLQNQMWFGWMVQYTSAIVMTVSLGSSESWPPISQRALAYFLACLLIIAVVLAAGRGTCAIVRSKWFLGLLCWLSLHDLWSYNCTCKRCAAVIHVWNGCKCTRCNSVRDQEHDWHGCKCVRCHTTRNQEHDWDGCLCRRCKAKRDQDHDWDACKCRRCGTVREDHHDWSKSPCKCRACGLRRPDLHVYEKCVCKLCGDTNHQIFDIDTSRSWTYTLRACSKCGATFEWYAGKTNDTF